jgi:translation initiation factor IF-2
MGAAIAMPVGGTGAAGGHNFAAAATPPDGPGRPRTRGATARSRTRIPNGPETQGGSAAVGGPTTQEHPGPGPRRRAALAPSWWRLVTLDGRKRQGFGPRGARQVPAPRMQRNATIILPTRDGTATPGRRTLHRDRAPNDTKCHRGSGGAPAPGTRAPGSGWLSDAPRSPNHGRYPRAGGGRGGPPKPTASPTRPGGEAPAGRERDGRGGGAGDGDGDRPARAGASRRNRCRQLRLVVSTSSETSGFARRWPERRGATRRPGPPEARRSSGGRGHGDPGGSRGGRPDRGGARASRVAPGSPRPARPGRPPPRSPRRPPVVQLG